MTQKKTTNNTPGEVAVYLKQQERVAVSTHVGADGDAIGSSVALVYLMRALGAEAVFCHAEEVPAYLQWLLPHDSPVPAECPEGYTLLVVDTSRPERVGARHEEPVGLNLDHHEDNPLYGEVNLVSSGAAASAEIVAGLYEELGVPLAGAAAEAVYTGVSTDTGGFRFRNISPGVHRLVAGLLEAGVVPAEVDDRINRTASIKELNIVGVSMANARRYGRAVVSTVDSADYERTGATELDSKEAIDSLRTVAGVEVVAHLREVPDGTKASLRSETVDVGEVARTFGGGGHRLAAGYTAPRPPEEAKAELLETLAGVVDLGESFVESTETGGGS